MKVRKLSRADIKCIIQEMIESEKNLKSVNWNDFSSLSDEEKSVWKRAMSIFKPAMDMWSKSLQQAVVEPRAQSKKTVESADEKFFNETSKAVEIFVSEGLEPPEELRSLEKSGLSFKKRKEKNLNLSMTDNKPLMIAVSNEDGNIVRLPEEEAIKYIQSKADDLNQKADDLQAQMNKQRAQHDDEMSAMRSNYMEKIKKNYESADLRQQKHFEMKDMFQRISMRILKQINLSKKKGDDAAVQALIQLGNTLSTAYSNSDEEKMLQLDRNTSEWRIDENRSKRLSSAEIRKMIFENVNK